MFRIDLAVSTGNLNMHYPVPGANGTNTNYYNERPAGSGTNTVLLPLLP